jgi:hypothetical protein
MFVFGLTPPEGFTPALFLFLLTEDVNEAKVLNAPNNVEVPKLE